MGKNKKGDWIVRMECTVIKDVFCSNCTEQDARENPFQFSVDEKEMDQRDYEVHSVEPNE